MSLTPAHLDLIQLLAEQAAHAWLRGQSVAAGPTKSGTGEGLQPSPVPDMPETGRNRHAACSIP